MIIETINYKGIDIEIVSDEYAESPREWDNLGRMVTWHRQYTLGDDQPTCDPEEFMNRLCCDVDCELESVLERLDRIQYYLQHSPNYTRYGTEWKYRHGKLLSNAEKMVSKRKEKALSQYIIVPVYMYDHSGISLSTRRPSCSWDSGQLGFIYCSVAKAKEYLGKTDDNEAITLANKILKDEVSIYNQYLNGEVYGYIADTDSCFGYYDYEECITAAKNSVDHNENATDYYSYRVGNHFIPALINDDFSRLSDEDQSAYTSWVCRCYDNAKNDGWTEFIWVEDDKAGFAKCEVTGLFNDCHEVRLLVSKKKNENKDQLKLEV
jgi:hypothetical protein